MSNRVVFTGVGIISTLGNDPVTVAEALRTGKSGIEVDPIRTKLGFQSALTGAIRGFEPKNYLTRKQRKTMPDFAVWAYAAVEQALEIAGLELDDLHNNKTGLVMGSDSSALATLEQVQMLAERGDTSRIGSGTVFKAMNSTVTLNLNTILGTRGACWTISSACSSGGHAIGQAADLIALGRQERVICGGVQEISWESICSFDGLGAFSSREDNPHKASCPFDQGRDGLVPSGGAAVVVLESEEVANKRGAKILGYLEAYGFSSDGEHVSVPSDTGLSVAIKMALKQASVASSDIDYICAHATSTPKGDVAEAKNILSVFKGDCPLVSSTKSMTGHELWMSGASQVVYSLLMNQHEFIAPNINFENLDEACVGLNVVSQTIERAPGLVLCNSMGFGGTNASLILRFPK